MQRDTEMPWNLGVRKGGLMNKKTMLSNLTDFKNAMHENRIPFIPIFGTLLGLEREGKLIDWDSDVDVFCDSKYYMYMKSVIESLTEKGFTIPCQTVCPMHDTFLIRNNEKIEIWWFDKIDDEYIYDTNVRYDKKFFELTEDLEFMGMNWIVPRDRKEFLKITYGDDWMIPNPDKEYILGRNK